jgi:hypothetical protein
MLPLIMSIVSSLIAANLPKVAQAVTDKGISYVEDKLGVKLEPNMTEEQLQAVRDAAVKHEEFQIEQDNKNTDSARVMNTGIQTSEHSSTLAKNAAYFIDFAIVGAAILGSWLAFFKGVPVENKELVYMALGSLWTLVGTVVNFHRGSSRASQSKDELIKKLST